MGRLLAEEERGEGDDEDQPRRQREDRVERERRPQSRRAILVPLEDRLAEQRPDDTRRETKRRNAARALPGSAQAVATRVVTISTSRRASTGFATWYCDRVILYEEYADALER